MQAQLRRLREKHGGADHGFTLIELLVVVVIIGVLVAIAIPVYLNYTKGAANKTAQSDVRAAVSVVEQYYTENGNTYPADATSGVGTNLTLPAQTNGAAGTVTVSPSNTIQVKNNSTFYVICGLSGDGGSVYVYNSSAGGSVSKSKQSNLATCISNGT
jgi:type IV pilus assembly protein PilA